MSSKYNEPWRWDEVWEDIFDSDSSKNCPAVFSEGSLGDECGGYGRRIVACVNACVGMEDPKTEIEQMRARLAKYDEREKAINAMADFVIERMNHGD